MILHDRAIANLAHRGMIEPFVDQIRSGAAASFGLSSYGYDARIADEFAVFDNIVRGGVIDPADMNPEIVRRLRTDVIDIPPMGFVLARTVEYFRIPDDVFVICVGKSTWARCGLIVNVTPLEPGWEGHVTLELTNTAPLPVRIRAGDGICQFVFLRGERPDVTYGDRKGKYQGQKGVVPPRPSREREP